MRFSSVATFFYLGSSLVSTASIPNTQEIAIRDIPSVEQAYSDLEKRKGGGGGGGGGKGGSGGSSSSGSSSSGSSSSGSSSSGSSGSGSSSSGSSSSGSGSGSSSSGSSGSRPASSYPFSATSNTGGRTRSGSGARPAFGGGRYYAGGATVPYSAGRRSPLGVAPFLLPVALLSFYPGLWLYGAYGYPYTHGYNYHNATNQAQQALNQTVNITCLCQQYSVCGCDDVNNNTAIADMMDIKDGEIPKNSSIVRVVDFHNGTTKLFINGTLPNGTTAPGGTDPSDASQIPSSMGVEISRFTGYWIMAATVLATVCML